MVKVVVDSEWLSQHAICYSNTGTNEFYLLKNSYGLNDFWKYATRYLNKQGVPYNCKFKPGIMKNDYRLQPENIMEGETLEFDFSNHEIASEFIEHFVKEDIDLECIESY